MLWFLSHPLPLPFLIMSVYGWLLERMPTMKSMQVCNAVFAMGKLNLYNAELCDALLQVRQAGRAGGKHVCMAAGVHCTAHLERWCR